MMSVAAKRRGRYSTETVVVYSVYYIIHETHLQIVHTRESLEVDNFTCEVSTNIIAARPLPLPSFPCLRSSPIVALLLISTIAA